MKVVVVCHDAGGAEMIGAWLTQKRQTDWAAYLSGPAEEVFHRRFGEVREPYNLDGVDLLLCGTSAESAWEVFAWRTARAEGIRTVAYLDHWKNYAARFRTKSGLALPDEVWVTDESARRLAERELPTAKVLVKGNPFLCETVRAVAEADRHQTFDGRMHVLCVYGAAARGQDIFRMPDSLRGSRVRHRPHPADASCERSLVEDVSWADVVVGFDSMAMVVALQAHRRVISVLPAGEELCLPFEGIERAYG